MKCPLIVCFLMLILPFAKSQNVSNESIKTDLIHTWRVSYMEMEGMQISAKPEAPIMIFEFYADKTLVTYNDKKPSEKTSGKWSYNVSKQAVDVQINGRPISSIVSLSHDTMTMMFTLPNTPTDLSKMKMILMPVK